LAYGGDGGEAVPPAVIEDIRAALLRVIRSLPGGASLEMGEANWGHSRYEKRKSPRRALECTWDAGMARFDADTRELVELKLRWPTSSPRAAATEEEIAKQARELFPWAITARTDLRPLRTVVQEFDGPWLVVQSFALGEHRYFHCGISAFFDKAGRLTELRATWPAKEGGVQNRVGIDLRKATEIAHEDAAKAFGPFSAGNSLGLGIMDVELGDGHDVTAVVRRLVWHVTARLTPKSEMVTALQGGTVAYYVDAENGTILLRQR